MGQIRKRSLLPCWICSKMPDFAKSIRQLSPLLSKAEPQRHLFQAETPATSISQQLQYLKTRHALARSDSDSAEAYSLPEGQEETTPYGRHYVVSEVFDGGHFHGKVRLARFS